MGKLVKKSCKLCLALLIGISIGYCLTNLLNDKKIKSEDCQCGS